MRKTLSIALSAAFFAVSAQAATPTILRTGDKLDVEDGATLTRWSVRETLREYGYSNFGPGALRGHIISITAYGFDGNRYLIKVHWTSHIVTHVSSPRNFWY